MRVCSDVSLQSIMVKCTAAIFSRHIRSTPCHCQWHVSSYTMLIYYVFTGVRPAYVTSSPAVAQNKANSLTDSGCGACEGLGMSGLYLALTHSRPDSDIYYFTDGDAKDAQLLPSVVSIALRKQCSIYSFVREGCVRRNSTIHRSSFEYLTTTTGGQLFSFTNGDLDQAVKLIRRRNVFHKNNRLNQVLLLTASEVRNWSHTTVSKTFHVQSDSSIWSMTVALSSERNQTDIEVVPPRGNTSYSVPGSFSDW